MPVFATALSHGFRASMADSCVHGLATLPGQDVGTDRLQPGSLDEQLGVLYVYPQWLPLTETWLHTQFASLPRQIRAQIVCNRTTGLDQWARRGFSYQPATGLKDLSEANLIAFNQLPFWHRVSLVAMALPSLRGALSGKAAVLHRLKHTRDVRVVHSHFGYTAWSHLEAVSRLKLRHVVSFYGVDMSALPRRDPVWLERYKRLFDRVDRVLCEGPHMARALEELGCEPARIRVQHLGVQLESLPFRPLAWSPEQPLRVLIAASFREKKGIPDAIEALAELRENVPVNVTVVGDAGHDPSTQAVKQDVLKAIDRVGLGNVTQLLGYQPHDRLLQLAGTHHVFLHPSRTALDGDSEGGAPVSLLEMAALGLAIVSTRHADIPHVLPHGVCARLAEEGDVPGLIRELRHLVSRPEDWAAMQVAARRRVETEFNSRRQGWRLASIYQELVH